MLGGQLTDDDEEAVMNELESIIAESIPSPVEEEPEPEKELEFPEVPPDEIPGKNTFLCNFIYL